MSSSRVANITKLIKPKFFFSHDQYFKQLVPKKMVTKNRHKVINTLIMQERFSFLFELISFARLATFVGRHDTFKKSESPTMFTKHKTHYK